MQVQYNGMWLTRAVIAKWTGIRYLVEADSSIDAAGRADVNGTPTKTVAENSATKNQPPISPNRCSRLPVPFARPWTRFDMSMKPACKRPVTAKCSKNIVC